MVTFRQAIKHFKNNRTFRLPIFKAQNILKSMLNSIFKKILVLATTINDLYNSILVKMTWIKQTGAHIQKSNASLVTQLNSGEIIWKDKEHSTRNMHT